MFLQDPKEALVAYKDLVVFLLQPSNREQIEKELLSRGASAAFFFFLCSAGPNIFSGAWQVS